MDGEGVRRALPALALVALVAAQCAQASSLRFVENKPMAYDFGDQRLLPPEFGRGEFTFELWFKADETLPVGDTDRGTLGQLQNWSEIDRRPYGSHGWWYEGNWLLDGHSRPDGFDPADSREGTFSLQFYGGGRLRWMFADDGLVVPLGMVWSAQAAPATKVPSLLDGQWHQVTCVRRWTGDSGAMLELWIDGALAGRQAIPQRVNMRRYWDSPPHPRTPKELGGWCWGSEVMTAWNVYFTQYEDYKGLLDELRFWDRAKSAEEIAATWSATVKGSEPGLVGWFPFDEARGDTARDRLGAARTIALHRLAWSAEDAPVR